AHPHVAPAELIFEPGIDALRGTALIVAYLLGKLVARDLLAASFGRHLGLAWCALWVLVDDRHVTESMAPLRDLRRIIGAVPQGVAPGHPLGGQRCKRDCHLAVVQRGGGQKARYRNVAVGRVDVQLVADPARLVALGITLGPDRTVLWQIVQHFGERHRGLALEPPRLLLDHHALFGAAALSLLPLGGGGVYLFCVGP